MIYGIEAAEESMYCIKKDPSYWSPVALTNKSIATTSESLVKKLEITLTFRQEQILKMIYTHGMTNQQIAKRLDLSESTVKMHIGIILKKYAVRDRSQLIFSFKEKIG
jgi:DNA-binding NarL/FixJ family response regulator